MVQLISEDILTREVLEWKGTHLFHFWGSSCSQKCRIFLNMKQADWQSHEIDLTTNQHYEPWFLGVNPRGLVPVLVQDGEVHIESNDIILLLDDLFDGPMLVPSDHKDRLKELLHHEDDLHLDLRNLTLRFTHPRNRSPKSPELLAKYRNGGSGKVQGKVDKNKARELEYFEAAAEKGITDDAIRNFAAKFYDKLTELDGILADQAFLVGVELTVLDIAWYVYVSRLMLCTYPMAKLHPNIAKWYETLNARQEFASQVEVPEKIKSATIENHRRQSESGTSLSDIVGW